MNNHTVTFGDIEISKVDLPFMAPPDRVCAIDLPPPISVNKTRKIDWRNKRKYDAWVTSAGMAIMVAGGMRKITKMPGQFELHITLDNSVKMDADNAIKAVADFLKRMRIIVDDSPKYMRRVTIEFGEAQSGMRVKLREIGAGSFVSIGEAANGVVEKLREKMDAR